MTDRTVTHEYADVLERLVAKRYRALAVGHSRSDGMWEGWIEFVDLAEDERLKTGIETMQSNERAFRYWAAGVGPAYLEGASTRARSRVTDRSARLAPPLSPLPYTQVPNVYKKNPTLTNFNPRLGFAWTPFDDQKYRRHMHRTTIEGEVPLMATSPAFRSSALATH